MIFFIVKSKYYHNWENKINSEITKNIEQLANKAIVDNYSKIVCFLENKKLIIVAKK